MKVWMAPRDIPVGGDHAHEAFLAIGQCSAVVVLLSWAAYESPFVRREAELAISLRTPVYPISIIPGMAGPRSRWGHYEGTRPYGWEFLIQGLQILYVPNVTVAVNEVVARLVGTSTSGSEPG